MEAIEATTGALVWLLATCDENNEDDEVGEDDAETLVRVMDLVRVAVMVAVSETALLSAETTVAAAARTERKMFEICILMVS